MKQFQNIDLTAGEIARSGAQYLATLVDGQGKFKYRFDPTLGKASRGYNVLRHCGTSWSMMDVIDDAPNDEVVESCQRAAIYLLNNFITFYGNSKRVCVVERDAIKLGGNALAIMALLSVNRVIKDTLVEEIVTRLGDYIISEQDKDGDFIHKRFFRSGKISQFRSMYYTGEALLALLCLYEATGDNRILNAVVKCEDHLCKMDYGVAEQSHWMLYALEALARHRNLVKYYKHAKKIARHIVEHPDYRDRAMSTPTACRSEGLLAFLRTPDPGKGQPDEAFRNSCLENVQKNLELQLTFRQPDGSFIRGGRDLRHTEIRIDYIQHNISSFAHFSRLMS
jgi:hypothetical protein